jgi:hypothetical protein
LFKVGATGDQVFGLLDGTDLGRSKVQSAASFAFLSKSGSVRI